MLRIERQPRLGAEQSEKRGRRNRAEDEYGRKILRPAHLVGRIDAADSQQPLLEGSPQTRYAAGRALKDAGEIAAQDRRERGQENQKSGKLGPGEHTTDDTPGVRAATPAEWMEFGANPAPH